MTRLLLSPPSSSPRTGPLCQDTDAVGGSDKDRESFPKFDSSRHELEESNGETSGVLNERTSDHATGTDEIATGDSLFVPNDSDETDQPSYHSLPSEISNSSTELSCENIRPHTSSTTVSQDSEVDESFDDADSGSCYSDSEEDSENEPSTKNEKTIPTKSRQRKLAQAVDDSTNDKKFRRRPAMNAREFVARLHEDEDAKNAVRIQQKRKSGRNYASSRKTPKFTHSIETLVEDDDMADSNLPSLQPFQATTHAAQFAKLAESIPEGLDTRRAATQKKDLKEAVKIFGYKRVEAVNSDWKLKGMETPLKNHQITAVAWMVKRELSRLKPYGGLLADEMGMGKTVMSLACIVGNPPSGEDIKEYCRATLVVVQNKTAAQQWQREIRKHCEDRIQTRTKMYASQDKEPRKIYEGSWIVIATYCELRNQFPDKTLVRMLEEKFDTDDVSLSREMEKRSGPLFRIDWYRVILDEGHAIKNIASRTAGVCCALKGKYRWALTGTPLANSSGELYPYLKFTQCEFAWSWTEFKRMYFTEGVTNNKFEALVSLFMYRRTMKDAFLSHRIIDIPDGQSHDLWISLSVEEQILVDSVDKYFEAQAQRLKDGEVDDELLKELRDCDEREEAQKKRTPKPNSSKAREVMLRYVSQVRMRQTISHAFCIEPLLRQGFHVGDIEALRKELNAVAPRKTILDQLQANDTETEAISRYQTGLDILSKRTENCLGLYFDMDHLLGMVENERRLKDVTCEICKKAKPPIEPIWSDPCHHVYCSNCLCRAVKRVQQRARNGMPVPSECLHEDCKASMALGEDIEVLHTTLLNAAQDKDFRELGKDSNGVLIRQEADRDGFFIASAFLKHIPVPPSTKVTAAMAVILTWLKEAPEDKIIVFVQFIGTAKMVGQMLEILGIEFVYFYGKLTQNQKNRALSEMTGNPAIKVLVSTLKSGNQGLNLTAANRVIIIDPWWNNTAEQQAFGRVVRIGQSKKSYLVRIKTREAIDRRIYGLQTEKAKDVDYTLQDDGHIPQHMSEIELQEAFTRRKSQDANKKAKRGGRRK